MFLITAPLSLILCSLRFHNAVPSILIVAHPLQATLPTEESVVVETEDENTPLITSMNGGRYGIMSPTPEEGTEKSGGRYTPVRRSFGEFSDLKPKPVWQLPHKDYDVREQQRREGGTA